MPVPDPRPLWKDVADDMRQRVASMEPGARIPTESELTMVHLVSRDTVRRALRELEAERLITRGEGRRGRKVAATPPEARMPTDHLAEARELLASALDSDRPPASLAQAAIHVQLATADALERIAGFFDRLGGEQDVEQAEKLRAAEVIEQRFARLIELLAMAPAKDSYQTNWILDEMASELLGPAYANWAAETGWSIIAGNAVAP